jgi:hypothetical protein
MKYTEKDLSLVIPARSNLKYAKWGYKAIRRASKDIVICYADDASNDSFWEWTQELIKSDPNVKAIRNEGPDRVGHTVLYNAIVEELVTTKLAMIYHCDMFCFPNTFKNCLKHMKEGVIVSSTRVEPQGLHPQGPEKHLIPMGLEPEEFNESEVADFVERMEVECKNQTTEGIFAPWMFFKKDFMDIGAHDFLFKPQSKEDSDIFNRFMLNGLQFIQSRDSFVAHLTCRGSRRNPNLTSVTQDSPEWLEHNQRSTRNFIRKWGHMVRHDALMKPIIPHKYNIGFVINTMGLDPQTKFNFIGSLEPWCSNLLVDVSEENANIVSQYIDMEQENTKFDMTERVGMGVDSPTDIQITFSAVEFLQNQQQNFSFVQQLPDILTDSGEIGELEYGCFKIKINALTHYEKDLIKCENTGWRRTNHK